LPPSAVSLPPAPLPVADFAALLTPALVRKKGPC
jgi:hypothetical protein